MGSFLNRLSAVGRSDGHQNVTLNSRKLTAEKRKNAKRGQLFFSTSRPGWAAGHTAGLSALRHACCVWARARLELGLPNEIEGAVPIINAASAVLPSFMGIVPEEGSTLPWAVFLSQNLRIHAVVS